jgi:hypothetical protein
MMLCHAVNISLCPIPSLLPPWFPTLKQRLNPTQRCHVSVSERYPVVLEAETFSKNVRQGVDSNAHRHGFRVREFSAVDRNFCFVLHDTSPLFSVLYGAVAVGTLAD